MKDEILALEHKVNITYIKMIVISSVVFMLVFLGEYALLTNNKCRGFGFFILSSILENLLFFSVLSVLLIVGCKLTGNTSHIYVAIGIIVQIGCYVGFVIYLTAQKKFEINIWQTILAIVISIILFLIAIIFSGGCYLNIVALNNLVPKTIQLIDFDDKYQHELEKYNEKVMLYNEMNHRIEEVGRAVDKKYKYKEINIITGYKERPHFDFSSMFMFNLFSIYNYFSSIDMYQIKCEKNLGKMDEQNKYITTILDMKTGVLKETERNVERINNPMFTDTLKQVFVEPTRKGYNSLKKRKYEKKIKSIESRKR